MERYQAYRFELRPTGEQERAMRRFAGSCRFVFNKALALQKENHAAGNKFIGYVDMSKYLTAWRNCCETPWLAAAPRSALQYVLKDLEKAYANFFAGRAKFPRFKRKGDRNAFRVAAKGAIRIEQTNSRLRFPKLGWLRYRKSRDIVGEPVNATISQADGKWFISIQTRREVDPVVPIATSAVGIDVGIARFATLSDGSFIAPLNSFKRHQQRLARYQRRMGRKVKFSNNWRKAVAKVQRIHTCIANARKDFLHKATAAISQHHALVCIEDLQVRNMSKSSKGSVAQPGKRVRQKAALNRSILDQGWGEFRRQLNYKMEWSGGMLLAVPPHHTSQTCPACRHVSKDNRQTQAKFLCVNCGYANHADVVGAANVLERGHRLLACGETAQSGRSKKQEPSEASRISSRRAVEIPVL
ncbi:transposase [Janthinobacterium sp. SUN137]|uniref:RNA-guided endonuclease InsQ/TnpB family protein n=1 Tax=Janthinobacterium sp. SUN137 TaxID=3014789 RepID=UPI002712E37E|nr:transposase [Janthinobacterium sp. SUN137]MDO8040379.1 transposase [Janthinobacterium sp. SUN137]